MSGGEALFAKLAQRLEGQPGRVGPAGVADRIAGHRANLIPARAQLDGAALVDLFAKLAEMMGATVERLRSTDEVPAAVGDFLNRHNLPQKIKLAPDPAVADLPWSNRPLIERDVGIGVITDQTSVTPAFAAIAETGTLMLHSGATTPTTLNFLPDNHVVVLRRDQIVGDYETAWAQLRAKLGGPENWPRTVNLITGPSRTADIEQELIMGAHGPRRLHILLIDGDAAQA